MYNLKVNYLTAYVQSKSLKSDKILISQKSEMGLSAKANILWWKKWPEVELREQQDHFRNLRVYGLDSGHS